MMRSFLPRLVDSAARAVVLAPCLLVCLACATPFPFENLEEGMTKETVRENFGAPEDVQTKMGGMSSWTYIHEELDPLPITVGPMSLRVVVNSFWGISLFWGCLFDSALTELAGVTWDCWYVSRKPVVVHFEEEKVVRWETFADVRGTGPPPPYNPALAEMQRQMNQRYRDEQMWRDLRHHKKGHTLHHGH